MIYPKISIIVPVYKVERYLPHCIDSILAQTFTDFELLLIDDGSPDNSGKICDEYAAKDTRIRVFHKDNGGVSSARNFGLDNANGEWIAFCDGDDWVDNTWLEDYMVVDAELIVQGFKATNWDKANPDTEISIIMQPCTYTKINFNDFYIHLAQTGNTGYLWCRLFKHALIRKYNIRFNVNYIVREDEEFINHYILYSSHISTIAATNYHYSVPNYSIKYKVNNANTDFDCTYNIIKYLNDLCIKKSNPIIIANVNRLSNIIKDAIVCQNYKSDRINQLLSSYHFLMQHNYSPQLCTMAKFMMWWSNNTNLIVYLLISICFKVLHGKTIKKSYEEIFIKIKNIWINRKKTCNKH